MTIDTKTNSGVAIVTGLWDLGRGTISGWANRDFEQYKERFLDLLHVDIPMYIWIPRDLESFVWEIRQKHNTKIYYKETEDFKTWFEYFDVHEKIRTSEEWYNSAGWLRESPQGALPLYNPMMMCKVKMLEISANDDCFGATHFYWLDGGISNTVPINTINKQSFEYIKSSYEENILHISFPYEPNNEIHGFEKNKFYELCNIPQEQKQIRISRGGFFGGNKNNIGIYSKYYHSILKETIELGYAGADENLFTIVAYQHPELVERHHLTIEDNALMWSFFEQNQKKSEKNNSGENKNMSDLSFLMEKYGSDKVRSGYTTYYEMVFDDIRNQITTFLEIGVGTLDASVPSTFAGNLRYVPEYTPGGSIRAWKDYFPNAKIYGIDVADDCKIEEERLETFIFSSLEKNQADQHFEDETIDIIIDDGLHTAIGQLATFRNFFSKVKAGGIYIIEDINGAGCGENVFYDYRSQLNKEIDNHEYYYGGNFLIIRKSYSEKGQLESLEQFVHAQPDIKNDNITVNDIKQYLKNFKESDIIDPSELLNALNNTDIEIQVEKNLTLVSGLWDLGRHDIDFDIYLDNLKSLLNMPVNLFLYLPAELEHLVWQNKTRTKNNTHIRIFSVQDIITHFYTDFNEKIQKIKNNPDWYNNENVVNKPQSTVDGYIELELSKIYLLSDATIINPFDTEYLLWADMGIANLLDKNTEWVGKIINNLDKFLITYHAITPETDFNGFSSEDVSTFSRGTIKYICSSQMFGGHKNQIPDISSKFYRVMDDTLEHGFLGKLENILTVLTHSEPIHYGLYELNGSIDSLLEDTSNDTLFLETMEQPSRKIPAVSYNVNKENTSIYVLSFNFPNQFKYFCEALSANDVEWTTQPKRKILINNSDDSEKIEEYESLCLQYGFEHIVTGKNLGINGGRLFAAKHFDGSDSDYYIFFEDDMTLHRPLDYIKDEPNYHVSYCRNGFRKFVPGLWDKIHHIMAKENFDFLKLNFTEVYMDNNLQVSWYNVPQEVRTNLWPEYDRLPISGLDPNCPRTVFDRIDAHEDLSYITGDIYYANWPMIVSKEGNKKMFLTELWDHPFEQTWMSYMYQETLYGNIKPAVLLASPIFHNRIAHYTAEQRREN